MGRLSWALLVLALYPSSALAQSSRSITREEALRLSPQQIAERVLRQIAQNVTSVTRPDYVSPFFPDLPLSQLTLATSPISSPYPGLCQTTVLYISFFDGFPPSPRGRNQPVRARSIVTQERYRVIGEVTLPYGLSQEGRIRQNPGCSELSSVIPTGELRLDHREFFRFHGDLSPQFGVAVLQRVMRGVQDGTYASHRCEGHNRCSDSGTVLRAISLDNLLGVRIERDATTPTLYTVTGTFLESGTTDTLNTLEVSVRAEFEHPSPRTIQRLGETIIRRMSIIRD